MKNIDDMKFHLKALEDLVKCAQQNLDHCKPQIEPLRKKIAALEAEAAYKKIWPMFVTKEGVLTECSKSYDSDGYWVNRPITVIEKKQLVITPALAKEIYKAGWEAPTLTWKQPEVLVAMFKAAGIDAISAD